MSSGVVRTTALRAGGACVRCRKGKTKCVYENGRAPCKNCAKGMHECYLPSESMAHHHGQSPARHTTTHRPARESLPAAGASAGDVRSGVQSSAASRHVGTTTEKLITPELMQECERVVAKSFPACVAFHKPSFMQQIKNASLNHALVCALLTTAARSSPALIRRYGGQAGATGAAEHFAAKAMDLINQSLDAPTLAEIQALCLIIIHEWGSRNAVRAYIYLGQAARMLQMYRILNSHHQQATADEPDRFLLEESFRRTLWLLYILDSLLVSTPGRHPALAAADITDVSLPCTDMNFAFGNAVFVQTLTGENPTRMPFNAPRAEVGEFGHIVLATKIWRDVVSMLTTTTPESFSDTVCNSLLAEVDNLRQALPMQFVDKPGQINLHITMGSGFTYAMIHCFLNCSHIFVHRRRLLQFVTTTDFNLEAFRGTMACHEVVDWLFTSCHSTLAMLNALEAGSDKDSLLCLPIFMLFSAFIASSTAAYLSLKGLTPPNAVETAAHLVRDGLHFMGDGVETWPLTASWNRHLTVMHRVLAAEHNPAAGSMPTITHAAPPSHHEPTPAPPSVKDEAGSNPDTSADAMDYDQQSNPPPSSQAAHGPGGSTAGSIRGDSEPPAAPIPRRPGITTINGGSGGVSTPATASPPPPADVKNSPPEDSSMDETIAHVPTGNGVPATTANNEPKHATPAPPGQDMTAAELCVAFERQLLELDDLAAFMGGGV